MSDELQKISLECAGDDHRFLAEILLPAPASYLGDLPEECPFCGADMNDTLANVVKPRRPAAGGLSEEEQSDE